jgi:KaiC/GvpD/RAD55 family RecA-like ATPase
MKVNTFLISETSEEPEVYSPMGVEEFLADGVIVLYNIRKGNTRENGIEVLKMRGAKHEKKIAAMQITDNGIEVYPDQEVFGIEK